jgi:[FeFe] hydrogenase H-cluster maturation GTPase HydF
MELLPLGPVMMIDTPGIDDEGQLGSLRVRKSYQVLNKTDVAVLVMDACHGPAPEDYTLLKKIGEKQIPCMAVCNKADVVGAAGGRPEGIPESVPVLSVSAHTGQGITALKECLANLGKTQETSRKIVGDLLSPSDLAVLVVPIDKAAPKGRLILPQQQTIRDILEADAVSVVVRENGLRDTLASLGKKPRMVITDSQVFAKVSADTPEDILLTSFSILFARYKGSLEPMVRGVRALDRIGKGDRILICEGCTHHRQCEDIGTVKLPGWIREYTGTEPEFVFTSGTEFPDDLAGFRLIVHCGGCMLNEREMKYRMKCAHDQGIPITNYGITIAYVQGILRRSVEPFPEIAALLCGSREG